MDDCLFCKISKGEIPAEFVYKDEQIVAFKDIKPSAPVHILIVPRKHLASLDEVKTEDQQLLGKMLLVVQKIAQERGIAQSGYRLVINNGEGAGQVIPHLHLHLLGGKKFD